MEWGLNLRTWDKEVFKDFKDANILHVLSQIETSPIPIEHLGQYNLDHDLFLKQTDKG